MRLPLTSMMDRVLLASREVARGNARQTLEAMSRRRLEHEEVEIFLRESQRVPVEPVPARRQLAQ